MLRYIHKILGAGIAILALASCSADFLDTKPTDSVGTSDAVGTSTNAMKALNGIAKIMTTQQYYYGQGFAGENAVISMYENYPSQNYAYNMYASGWSPIMNQEFHAATDRKYASYVWYYYYTIIGNANTIICNIDGATGSQDEKNYIKAAALTFRAYAYQKLALYYCLRWTDSADGSSQGLVLRTDESTGDMPYSTLKETYQLIYSDLDEALSLYGQTTVTRPSGEVWLPDASVAHAVYARAALTRQDYARAVSEAKLARQHFPLMSNDDYHKGFCKPTGEWLFGSYGSEQENNWYWSFGTFYSCNGYTATNKGNIGAGAIGRELINRIPDNDARKALFLTEDKFPGYNFSDGSVMDQTFGIMGFGSDKTLSAELAAKAKAYCAQMTPSGLSTPYTEGDYYLGGHLKFWVFGTPGVSYLPFIRSSEMVLIEAEGSFKQGKEAEAIAALVELNKTSGRNADYACTKSGDALWNEIMDYRELELWGEGFAWSDYKRWNRDVVRHGFSEGGNAHVSIAKTIKASDANKWTWEVPLAETDYNEAVKK